jgi:YD repeat-containing protein
MATKKIPIKKFPRNGMSYQDRFRMTVKEFGRLIVIDLNRGTAEVTPDGKKVTIRYDDDENRKSATKPRAKKSAAIR